MLKKQSKILKEGSKKSKHISAHIFPHRSLPNEKLPNHHFKKVKVKRGMSGLGLFAEEDIKKGEIIIEYIGNILNKEEADAISSNQYLFEINRNKTIDGSPRYNTARYVNHACEGAENAESDIIKGRVFIKAIKKINKGDEILYDYGEEFFNEYIKPKGCLCKVHSNSK